MQEKPKIWIVSIFGFMPPAHQPQRVLLFMNFIYKSNDLFFLIFLQKSHNLTLKGIGPRRSSDYREWAEPRQKFIKNSGSCSRYWFSLAWLILSYLLGCVLVRWISTSRLGVISRGHKNLCSLSFLHESNLSFLVTFEYKYIIFLANMFGNLCQHVLLC